jgi:hypothetical protein
MSNHLMGTPHPWYVDVQPDGEFVICWHKWREDGDYDWRKIATVHRTVDAEEDADLIAAAPDLLAACQQAMRECCDLQGTPAGNAIEAAIAKARGQE